MSDESDTLFDFPCDFPIKVMGADEDALALALRAALRRHAPECADNDFVLRSSSKGRYVAITVTIRANSKPQLDAIYQMLTDADAVLVAL